MATTSIGPIRESRINQAIYAGEMGVRTIQAAVNYATQKGGSYIVVIPQGYAGADLISGVINGSASVYLCDQRTPSWQYYSWSGAAYVPADFIQQRGYVTLGLPSFFPPGSAALTFDPAGSSGAGSVDLRVTSNTGTHHPAFNLQIADADGSNFHTFIRADVDPATFIPRLTLPEDAYITGTLSVTGDAVIGGDIGADDAQFETCEVDGSPVRTFDNTPDQVYPPLGIPTSTGQAWGASIDPLTLAYVNKANVFGPNQTMSGNLNIGGILTLSHDPTQPLQAATRQYVDQAIIDAGGFVFPPAGVTVSTGEAWGTPIDPATIAYLDKASNAFVGNLSVAGTFTGGGLHTYVSNSIDGTVTGTLATMRLVGGAGVTLNAPVNQTLYVNFDSGAGIVFGDGGRGTIGTLDAAGNLRLNGSCISGNNSIAFGTRYVSTGFPNLPSCVGDVDGTLYLTAATAAPIRLNWDHGTGVIFGDGAGNEVAQIDSDGNLTVKAEVSASADNLSLNAKGDGSVLLNWKGGGKGTHFGDGNGGDVGNIDVGGTMILIGNIVGHGNAVFGGSVEAGNLSIIPNSSSAAPGPSIRTDANGSLILNAGAPASVYLNWDGGATGEVIFGNGAGAQVANVNTSGNAIFSGWMQAAQGTFAASIPPATDFNNITAPGNFFVDGANSGICPNAPQGMSALWVVFNMCANPGPSQYMVQLAMQVDDWGDGARWIAMRKQTPSGWGTWGYIRQT